MADRPRRAPPGDASRDAAGCTVAILARAPVPGIAKTRLVPRLGRDGAAAIHELLLCRTVRSALASGVGPVTVWCDPHRGHPALERLRELGPVALRDQPPGDLGDRIHAALCDQLAAGDPAVLVGADCPGLGPAGFKAARDALREGADAVLAPAEDGGYGLVGLRRPEATLFAAMPWGSAAVMGETRRRLRGLGLRWVELAAVRDVDLPADLGWLAGAGILEPDELALLRTLLEQGLRTPSGAAPRRVGD